ncbi:MAG: ATP-binding protein [Steroidobacteraceae bacterium]
MADLKQTSRTSQDAAATYWRHAIAPISPARWLIWGSIVGLTTFLLLGLLAWRTISVQFEELNRQRAGVVHSRDVLNVLISIRDRLQQGMTGARLYAQTGSRDFLQAYDAAQREFPKLIEQLQALVTTEAGQQAIAELQQASQASLDYAGSLILAEERGELSAAERSNMISTNGENVATMRRALEAWREREIATLINGDKRTEQQLLSARRYTYTVLCIGVLVILALSWLLLRYTWRRRQMEHHLRVMSELWSGTLASLSEGVGLYSMDRRLLLWNPRFAEIHGVPEAQLYPGIGFAEVIRLSGGLKTRSFDDSVASAARTAELVRNGGHQDVEHERADGMILRVTAAAMGKDHYVVTLSDVTLMRRSEQLARDQATRLGTVMDNVPDAIVTLNASGSIESWSAGAQRLFGYSADEVLRRSVNLLFAEHHANQRDGYVQRCLDGDGATLLGKSTELDARRKNGSVFPVELRISEMQVDTRRMLVAILRDMTEPRAVERMKGEFVATVSHELRTPLTSIAGSLALLSGGAGGQLPAAAQRLLDIAHRNSQRLTVLINDILELEKAESGRSGLRLVPQSLLAVVQQAIEANRGYAQQQQVQLTLHNDAGDPVVLLDEARLMQVLANLLTNAIKFSPPGAPVMIAMERCSGSVRVTIHDNGPGVPESFRERIFLRFAQADNSNTRRTGGTGLGLAISKSLIEQHRGIIGFDSGQSAVGGGQGASFWFELPLAVAGSAELVAFDAALAGVSILACEDDPDIAQLLRDLLAQRGCHIEVVSAVAAAQQALRDRRPDLLLVDVNLPDVDGLALIDSLRAEAEYSTLPIIILTALDGAQLDDRVRSMNVSACLRKPVAAQELYAALAGALAAAK